jgi:rubrerythrin
MASIGNPFIGNIPQQMSNEDLIQAIRLDIIDELEAIISYEAHITATNDERAKKILANISDEEKKHVGKLQQLLTILSPKDSENIEKGKQAIIGQQNSNFQTPLE